MSSISQLRLYGVLGASFDTGFCVFSGARECFCKALSPGKRAVSHQVRAGGAKKVKARVLSGEIPTKFDGGISQVTRAGLYRGNRGRVHLCLPWPEVMPVWCVRTGDDYEVNVWFN